MSLNYELSSTKQRYREIFTSAQEALFGLLTPLQENYRCEQSHLLPLSADDLLEPFHEGCGYRAWQQQAIEVIESQVAKEVLIKLKTIEIERAKVQCHSCGVCCRLASSEFNYDELKAKAAAGDDFARQFTSVFLPYQSTQAAQERFPVLVNDILAQVGSPEQVHFYHCPHIHPETNQCTIYGTPQRPKICEGYPDTPLTFIYDKCAWKPWKDNRHTDALLAHAMIELCSFTLGKLKDALAEPSD